MRLAIVVMQIVRLFPTVFSGTHIGLHREVYLFRGLANRLPSTSRY